jgi:outer membrane receptor protein involved in Fe transport
VRSAHTLLLAMVLISGISTSTGASTWTARGEELRRLHADTMEELLRQVPFLRVERFGGSGLPFRVMPAAGTGEDLLLVVDGLPWRDPWTGNNLWEEVPMALIEEVVVDTNPASILFGDEALAGVVMVTTRRREGESVQTRIHLTRGDFEERTRRVSFETPAGQTTFAIGLDEFLTRSYVFYRYWGGPDSPVSALPVVTLSQRRTLVTRLDLDFDRLGPLECQLVQGSNRIKFSEGVSWGGHRDFQEIRLTLPRSPWGVFTLKQSLIQNRMQSWRSLDLGLLATWISPAINLNRGGEIIVLGGIERHQLSLEQQGIRALTPRPAKAWLAASGTVSLPFRLTGRAGMRWESRLDIPEALLYQVELGWADLGDNLELELYSSGGQPEESWRYNRLPGWSYWPEGVTSPDTGWRGERVWRTGLKARLSGETNWVEFNYFRQENRRQWLLEGDPTGGYGWGGDNGSRNAMGLDMGTRRQENIGQVGGRLSILTELESREYRPQDSDLGVSATDPGGGFPWLGNLQLDISRPFSESDANLDLAGGLEYRGGLDGHYSMWRLFTRLELQLIDARFWVKLDNVLNWAGEEIPAFPVQPMTLRMGFDWHLDR